MTELILDKKTHHPFNYELDLISNRWEYIKRILINGDIIPPFEVEIQPASNCNLSCSWCVGIKSRGRREKISLPELMNEENAKILADHIINYKVDTFKVETVKISGFMGDPLIKPNVVLVLLDKFAQAGIDVGLFTNGVLLDKINIQKLISNLKYVHISLDADSPESFFKLKGSYEFERVLSNIEKLVSKRRNLKKPEITVGFILTKDNCRNLSAIVQRLKNIGVDRIRFKKEITSNFEYPNDLLFKKIKRKFNDHNFHVSLTNPTNKSTKQMKIKCWAHALWATVGPNGNMYPCDHCTFRGAPSYGNLFNRSLKAIWESQQRKILSSALPISNLCSLCSPFTSRTNYFLNKLLHLSKKIGIKNLDAWVKKNIQN